MGIVTSRSLKWLVLCVAFVGAVFALVLSTASPAQDNPVGYSITWSPTAVSEAVAPGARTSAQVSVTSKTNLQDVTLEATPGLVPFLILQPSNVPTLAAGHPQDIQITLSVPSETPVGSYNGTVHLRVGTQTLPQTLKVAVVVSQVPVIVQIPTNFQPNSQVISQGGPLLLNNFGSQYQHGGLIPPGGAEITITTNTLPRPPLSNFISNELQGATIASTSTIMVSGNSCTEVFYSDSYGQNNNYSNIAVYCPHNGTLYKLFLFYTAGDPATAQFLSAFQQILNTVQFTL